MNLLNETIGIFQEELHYQILSEFEDSSINEAFNNWIFLEQEYENIVEHFNLDADTVLYSAYYWSVIFLQKYHEVYGNNAGYEQQQFQLLEKMDYMLNEVDWELLAKIDGSLPNEKPSF